MKCPNRLPIIIGGVVGAVALAVCLLLPKDATDNPDLQATDPTENVQIQVPTEPADSTDPTEVPPVIVIPGDDAPVDPNDPTDPPPIIIPGDDGSEGHTDPAKPTEPIINDPIIEDVKEEEVTKVPATEDEIIPEDNVSDIGKYDDEEQSVDQGEIRNDTVLEEKEEAIPPVEKEEHEVIVEEEKVTVGEEKGEVHENEEKPNPNGNESNKNASEYQPPAGGDNPFDDDVETEIKDTPVEDLIGDGEDRPGEGTHF